MNKIYAILIAVSMLAGLAACTQKASSSPANSSSGNTPEVSSSSTAQSPELNIKADSSSVVIQMPSEVKAGETATATIVNNSSFEISYGAEYSFEYFANDQWTALKPKEGKERMWIAIAYITQPGEEAAFDFVIYPDEFTEPVQPGKYRLVKSISSDNGGAASSFKITGEFTIK